MKEKGKERRKGLRRAKHASLTRPWGRVRREKKKPTVRFPYNEFAPTRGFKNVVELSKICSQLHPLCEFDSLGDWLRGRIARVMHLASNLDSVSSKPYSSKQWKRLEYSHRLWRYYVCTWFAWISSSKWTNWSWYLPGGALGYFLGGYVPPWTPNWHPVPKNISPKIDTPF